MSLAWLFEMHKLDDDSLQLEWWVSMLCKGKQMARPWVIGCQMPCPGTVSYSSVSPTARETAQGSHGIQKDSSVFLNFKGDPAMLDL